MSACCSPMSAKDLVGDVKKGKSSDSDDNKEQPDSGLQYGVEDIPPPHLCFLFGLQQVLQSISSTITVPLVTTTYICAGDLPLVRSQVMSTFLFMCGVCTVLQCFLGVRLPILQGGCHKFLPAIAAFMLVDKYKCPDMAPYLAQNSTLDPTEIWQSRMREIQGGIMIASLVQVVVGFTGLLGTLLQFIGPITIVPTITLVGLSLIDVALGFCKSHWGISALTTGLLLIFSLYLRNVSVPVPAFDRKRKCYVTHYPVFKLLPVLLAVAVAWGLCAILTTAGVADDGMKTDSKTSVLEAADWFFFPYPGQWGVPSVSVAGVIAMLAATIASMIESVGDYYACARVCGVPPPPAHAINRGIAAEGIGSLISGAVGSGGATTSYSQNVGAIGFTRVGSRAVFLTAGVIFFLVGIIGKIGAFLTTMPDPVLGGVVLVSFGMVTSVGLSTLSFVDLSSTRNLTIIGLTILVGLMVPRFIRDNPDSINTGSADFDTILKVLLGIEMFVGGLLACFLDNTVPGTSEERGIKTWRQLASKFEETIEVEVTDDDGDDGDDGDDVEQGTQQVHNQKEAKGTEMSELFNMSKISQLNGEAIDKDSDTKSETANGTTPGNKESEPRVSTGYKSNLYDIPFITPYLFKVKCFRYWPFLPSFQFGNVNFQCRRCKKSRT